MIFRSTDIRAALKSRQRGFLLNPFRFGSGGGGGGSPTLAAFASTVDASGTSRVLNQPTDIAAGDLLVLVLTSDGSGVTFTLTASGWNGPFGRRSTTAQGLTLEVFWKIADGSDTVTFNTSASEETASYFLRITNASTLDVVSSSFASTASPNPPSLTLAGTENALWIAGYVGYGAATITTPPADYGDEMSASQSTSSANSTSRVGLAFRSLSASSEDPGAFAISNFASFAFTLAAY